MRFNLSAWALHNRQLVVYFMLLLVAVVGVLSYSRLGQSEDPPFTFKAKVVSANWPGAPAEEVARQVTERIEQTLMEAGEYERIVSYSRLARPWSSSWLGTPCLRVSCPISGTRSARRSATCATPCHRPCRGRSSTTSSAPPSATSTP